jgi:homoserine dehydrogenase
MIPPASTPPTSETLPIVTDVASAFYLHLEVDDEPGVLAGVASELARYDVSVKSVVQKGLGAQARLVMVVHRVLESRFAEATEAVGRLSFLRSAPRSIRVIEEQFG